MRFALSDEQEALRREARRFLQERSPPAVVRRAMASETGWDADAWRALGEMGWTSLAIPEAYGGAGLGQVELAAVLEEMGRALFCGPFFSTVCLGAPALVLGGDEAQKRAWLPALGAGRATATLAFADAAGRTAPRSSGVTARRDAGGVILDGASRYVVDGHIASLLLIVAGEAAGGDFGAGVYLVPAETPGLTRRAQPALDATRKLAELRLDGVRLPDSARLPGDGAALVERVLARARIALAAEQLGGAERCLELSVDYAKTRTQFGRPIGSFQAIKHKCADLLVLVESARSAAWWAAFVAATSNGAPAPDGGDGALPGELEVAAALAHSYCSEAYLRAAGETIQVHGGIGFTWEHDAHLYFRRARSSASLLGEPRAGRERLARHLGLT